MRHETVRLVEDTKTSEVLEYMAGRQQAAGEVLGDLALSWAIGGQLIAPLGFESATSLAMAESAQTYEQAMQTLAAVTTYEDIHRTKQVA